MAREPHIPLFLWIATALLVHLTGGEGAERAAEVLGERMDVRRFAASVQRHVSRPRTPIEVSLLDAPEDATPPEDDHPDETPPDTPADVKPEETDRPPAEARPADVKPEHDVKVDQPDEEKKPEEKKPEEKKPPEPKKADEPHPPQQDFPAIRAPNRIAVQQHVEDKNQEDNPNAEFIADDANRVEQQTQARITATDQNDPDPTPGTSEQGPPDTPGNAHVTDIAQSDDTPGEVDHAPNEHAAGAKVASARETAAQGAARSFREVAPNSRAGVATGSTHGSKGAPAGTRAQSEHPGTPASREALESPEVVASRDGSYGMGEPSEARMAHAAEPPRKKRLPPLRGQPNALDFLGLGSGATTASGINLNLSAGAALAAVGRDQLGREALADGERRRSQHRGSWRTVGLEKWRASIENYNASVRPGNQTALNTARVPFATYLNQIHNRLHPIFADSFLASLDGLPPDSPLNRQDMKTNLEIVLDKEEGKIVKMGVTRASGATAFDIAALESVQNAAPFGKPPAVIVSPDGNVYLHWEFYRNPFYACSTYFAHPFLLKAAPESAPPHVSPPGSPPPFGPRERPIPSRGDLGQLDPSLQRRMGATR